MTPEIRDFPETFIVGLEAPFDRHTMAGIVELWKRLNERMDEIVGATGRASYGVSVMKDRASLSLDYLAAAEVTDLSAVPDGMTGRRIGGGPAAVFTVPLQGVSIGDEIGAAYDVIWREWIPGADYLPAGGYDFERYDERFDPATLSGEMEIVIPVKPKDG